MSQAYSVLNIKISHEKKIEVAKKLGPRHPSKNGQSSAAQSPREKKKTVVAKATFGAVNSQFHI